MFVGYIYMIRNKINDKKYIGQTIRARVEDRWKGHIYPLNKGLHGNDYLQKSWNKYVENNFEFSIIETLKYDSSEELYDKLNKLEAFYIEKYKTLISQYGYNIRPGGSNSPHSLETKQKMRLSALGPNNYWYGKHQPLEARLKVSETLKGRIPWNKGLKMKEETKQKISNTLLKNGSPFKGKTHSEETRKIMSEKAKGRKHTEESKFKIGKASRKNNLNKRWEEKELIAKIYLEIMRGSNPKVLAKKYNKSYATTILEIKFKRGECGKVIEDRIKKDIKYREEIENSLLYYLVQINEKYFNSFFLLKLKLKPQEIYNIHNKLCISKLNHKIISEEYKCDIRIIDKISRTQGIFGDIINFYKENEKNDIRQYES